MKPIIQAIMPKASSKNRALLIGLAQVVLGSAFLALISLVKVPLYPTPMTLQTLGVFMLALALGPYKGALAVICYLLEATCGWPVLSGGVSNPLWMVGPNGGFLLSFVLAAWVIGFLVEKCSKKTFLNVLLSIVCGQICIYILGLSWLSYFFGFKQALMVGLVPFWVTAVIKAVLAATTYRPVAWVQRKIPSVQ